jgi:rhodanese-related sulfurtransferase
MVHTELNSIGLKGVSPEKASQMQKKGWTIVDTRIEGDFDADHAEGAVNLPLYRFVQVCKFQCAAAAVCVLCCVLCCVCCAVSVGVVQVPVSQILP